MAETCSTTSLELLFGVVVLAAAPQLGSPWYSQLGQDHAPRWRVPGVLRTPAKVWMMRWDRSRITQRVTTGGVLPLSLTDSQAQIHRAEAIDLILA